MIIGTRLVLGLFSTAVHNNVVCCLLGLVSLSHAIVRLCVHSPRPPSCEGFHRGPGLGTTKARRMSTASLYRRSPTPLCGLRHGVIRWFVRHRCLIIDPRLSHCRPTSLTVFSVSLVTVTRYFPSRGLMTFSLSCTRAAFPTLLNFVATSGEALSECLNSGSAALLFDFDLASCLVVSGHFSTQTCAH